MLDAQSHKTLPNQNEIHTNENQGVVEIPCKKFITKYQ